MSNVSSLLSQARGGDGDIPGGNSKHHDGGTRAAQLDGGRDRCLVSDAVIDQICTAPTARLVNCIASLFPGLHRNVGSDFESQCSSSTLGLDDEHSTGSSDSGQLCCEETDRASSHHDDHVTDSRAASEGGMQCDRSRLDHRGLLIGDVRGDLHETVGWHYDSFSKGAVLRGEGVSTE